MSIASCSMYSYMRHVLILLQVFKALSTTDISPSVMSELEDCFSKHENPFVGLETKYKQMQYCLKNFDFCVSHILIL